jgi:CRP/FNR family transcriptional regulator, cyclic AMP receptor protein
MADTPPRPPHSRPWPDGTLLSRLPDATRERLLRLGTPRRYPSGHLLINQGDRGETVYLLINALVKVSARVENGVESLLGIRVGGDVVGEMAVLSGDTRSASVVTCGPASVAVIPAAVFTHFTQEQPTIGLGLSQMIGDRLRWANERRLDAAAYGVTICLARALLKLADRYGHRHADQIDLGVPLTQAELAALIGAKEVTVQRALRTLQNESLVARGRRRVVILDREGLADFAELNVA